jgi:nondiscriminating aspartyl-tRNA synthetase
MISKIVDTLKEKNQDDLEYLQLQLPSAGIPFSRYSYSDIIDKLQEAGERIQWGDDISPQIMKSIKHEYIDDFYFIIDWPTSTKPFYIKPSMEDSRICESFDLMYGGLEVSSGSTRINHKDQLVERMTKQGLKPEAFDYHLRVFDYGVPPHAGFGLGLERLMMALTKVENIRDVTLYPRDIDRLAP